MGLPKRPKRRQLSRNYLEVVTMPTARKGFVLLAHHCVVERTFGCVTCFRRLVQDPERLPGTVACMHFVAFADHFPKLNYGL